MLKGPEQSTEDYNAKIVSEFDSRPKTTGSTVVSPQEMSSGSMAVSDPHARVCNSDGSTS